MRFESPLALIGLALLPLVGASWWWIERRRDRTEEPFARPELVAAAAPRGPGWRRRVPPALLLVAVALLLLAVARPHARVPVRRERATVILALDASRSMEATDVAPSRIEAAKRAARQFLEQVPAGFRVGAVAFSGKARLISPPTQDLAAVATAISALETSRGTLIGDAVVEALRALRADAAASGRTPSVIVLLSDGNDTGSRVSPGEAATRARAAGVEVDSVAVGDTAVEVAGNRRPPNVELLRSVARAAGGSFFPAATEEELRRIYADLGAGLAWMWSYREVTVAFVGIAALCAAACGVLSAVWFRSVP